MLDRRLRRTLTSRIASLAKLKESEVEHLSAVERVDLQQ
jgi:hypothetical protein